MGYISGIPIKRLNMDCRKPADPGIYYHYTSLETLWAILETETLRATQARFSNDSEEIKKGVRILEELCSQSGGGPLEKYANRLKNGDGEDIDCYIACFCGDSDVLSQWRGYCRSDGVSVGFAFDETRPCYYFKDADDDEQVPQAIRLYPVWYVAEEGKEDYKDKKIISEKDLKDELSERLEELDKLYDEQTCKVFIDAAIPLIKHAGFCEEDEYRLMIRNTPSEHGGKVPFPLNKYVRYSEVDGTKRPYITISFGKNRLDSHVEEVRLYGLEECGETELHRLLEPPPARRFWSRKRERAFRLVRVDGWEGKPQIIIGPGEDQQEIFEALDRILTADAGRKNRLFPEVKLWCEGHLPIRSIMVSPCQDQKEVIESIQHYCVHKKFWMKYVEVSGSATPYRRPK